VVYLSPSAVYRILDRHDLLYRWKRSSVSGGHRPQQASHPDEVWHTDLLYLRIAGRWYFLVSVLDSYSRYIVAWELALSLAAAEVVNVVHAALEAKPGVRPKIVRDNGSQFMAREWRQLVSQFELMDIATRSKTLRGEASGVEWADRAVSPQRTRRGPWRCGSEEPVPGTRHDRGLGRPL
jgi:transposase InsO family protein